MFKLQTTDGPKSFILRGAQTQRGKKKIGKVSFLDTGLVSRVIYDNSGAGPNAFDLSIAPSTVSGAGASGAPMSITTTTASATAAGFVGSVRYEWTKTGGAGSWLITAPLAANTRFEALFVDPNTIQTATFTCTATDSAGRTATATVSASARNYGSPTGGPLEP